MEWAPGLNRQRSCPPAVLDVAKWCSGSRQFSRRFNDNDRHYYGDDEFEASDYTTRRSTQPIWLILWRRIVKEKNRLFLSRARAGIGLYDPYTYAQNFDQGSTWQEPENLTRSFSARFADPSKSMILHRKLD